MDVDGNQQAVVSELDSIVASEDNPDIDSGRIDDIRSSMAVEGNQSDVLSGPYIVEASKDYPNADSERIDDVKTSVAVEGIQQAVVCQLDSVIASKDSPDVDSEKIDEIRTGMAMKGNEKVVSALYTVEASKDNPNADSRRIDDVKSTMAVEGNQHAVVSELGGVLASEDNPNDNFERTNDVRGEDRGLSDLGAGMAVKENQRARIPELDSALASRDKPQNDLLRSNFDSHVRANDVMEEAMGFEASAMLSPINVKDGDETKEFHASTMISPAQDQDNKAETRINAAMDDAKVDEKTNEIHASEMISPVQDQDNKAETRISDAMDEAMDDDATNINSPSILSKCTSAHGSTLESKRLSELRERKRSKYLSPPYVNLSKNARYSAVLLDGEGSFASRSGSTRKTKTRPRKSPASSGNLQEIRAASGELLSELHLAALDSLYPFENEHFDLTEIFFASFRSSIFHKEMELGEEATTENATVLDDNDQKLTVGSPDNCKPESKKRKKKEKTTDHSTNLVFDAVTDEPAGSPNNSEPEPKKRNRREKTTNGPSNSKPESKRMKKDPAADGLAILVPDTVMDDNDQKLQAGSPNNSEPEPKKRKRKEKTTNGPDVSGPGSRNRKKDRNDGSANLIAVTVMDDNDQKLPAGDPSNSEPKKRKRKEKTTNGSVNLVPDALYDVSVKVAATPSSIENPPSPNFPQENKESVSNTNGLGTVSQTEGPKKRGRKKGAGLADENPERKKRRRKRKDGTYAEYLPNVTNMTNAKPISLEVCLGNVGPILPITVEAINDHGPPKSLSKPEGEMPSVSQIREKLGKVMAMLEKSGDSLSLETKVTLENEIRGLLKQVTTIPSSSSS